MTPKFGNVDRVGPSSSNLEAWGFDADGEEGANIRIVCAHEDPDVERAMIGAAVRACNTHDELVGALSEAEGLLDSVAFLSKDGDTAKPLQRIRAALSAATN